jgi:hypothetical protein
MHSTRQHARTAQIPCELCKPYMSTSFVCLLLWSFVASHPCYAEHRYVLT